MQVDRKNFIRPRESARVLVIGAGGLGSAVLACLARSGIGTIGIADGDVVEITNLHRQVIHTSAGVGRSKAESAEEFMRHSGFAGAVVKHAKRLGPGDIVDTVSGYDFVIDASDTFRSKYMINDACVMAGVPFVHAGVVRFEGQMMTVLPRATACLRCLFPSPPVPAPTCREVGVLGAAAGLLGAFEAAEALKFLDGAGELTAGRLLSMDAKRMRFSVIPLKRDAACALCGDNPSITSMEGGNCPG